MCVCVRACVRSRACPKWNDIDGRLKNSENNLSHYHFIHYKSHIGWPKMWTWATMMTGQWLTTWAMAWPWESVPAPDLMAVVYYRQLFNQLTKKNTDMSCNWQHSRSVARHASWRMCIQLSRNTRTLWFVTDVYSAVWAGMSAHCGSQSMCAQLSRGMRTLWHCWSWRMCTQLFHDQECCGHIVDLVECVHNWVVVEVGVGTCT
jgi:hypothetical protein